LVRKRELASAAAVTKVRQLQELFVRGDEGTDTNQIDPFPLMAKSRQGNFQGAKPDAVVCSG